MKKILISLIIFTALLPVLTLPALAASSISVSLRIEGKSETLYFGDVVTSSVGVNNVLALLKQADAQKDSLTVEGLDYGYITAINGEASGQTEKGFDTYNVRVNGEYIPHEQLKSHELKDGDEVLVYYSDEFGDGFIFPIVDTEKISEGYIRFTYEQPSEDGKFSTSEALIGATLTWYCDDAPFTYTTDARGGVYIDKHALTSGKHYVSLNMYRADGTPMLLRFAPDFQIDVPIDIGDSNAAFVCAAAASFSLICAALLALSLKKKSKA